MPEGILLSQNTYERIMAVVKKAESGGFSVTPGTGLKIEEQGPGGTTIGVDGTDVCPPT